MRLTHARAICLSALIAGAVAAGAAQEPGPAPQKTAGPADPRVGLKPGLRDAGVAARNMELVVTIPKPKGFFDPTSPAGDTVPAETPAGAAPAPAPPSPAAPAPGAKPAPARPPFTLNFANSDMAFGNDRLFVGNFNGFNIYDVKDPRKPKLLASVACPGGQGDVSVHGTLLFMSVEQTRDGSTAAIRASMPRSAPTASAASGSSTSATSRSRSRWQPSRRAGAPIHTRSSPIRRTPPTCTCTGRARARCGRVRNWPDAPIAIRRTTRTARSSAST